MKEDEFYDAIDQSLDRLDRESDDLLRTVSIVYFYTYITHSKSTVSIQDKNKMYKIMCSKEPKEKRRNLNNVLCTLHFSLYSV